MIGQALQHVADVDHDGIGIGGERHPLALAREHFQTFRAGAYQQGDQVDVFMRTGAHIRHSVGGDWRVVNGAQDRVAAIGLVGEIVFRQSDVQRQSRQHFLAQAIP